MKKWTIVVDPYDLLWSSIALFIIMDIPGNIPIFLILTKDFSPSKRKTILDKAIFSASILLISFALMGEAILYILGISIESFMIAGGILLLIIAIDFLLGARLMLRVEKESVGIVPMGTPLIAGPGAITTTIALMKTKGRIETLFAILVCSLLSWLILRDIERINKIFGRTGLAILSKVLALLIAAIAIEMIKMGIAGIP